MGPQIFFYDANRQFIKEAIMADDWRGIPLPIKGIL